MQQWQRRLFLSNMVMLNAPLSIQQRLMQLTSRAWFAHTRRSRAARATALSLSLRSRLWVQAHLPLG